MLNLSHKPVVLSDFITGVSTMQVGLEFQGHVMRKDSVIDFDHHLLCNN